MVDWSCLLPELLMEISKKIDLIQDFVNFGCVCKPWLWAASAAKFNTQCRLPLLMLPAKEDIHVREFYDISMEGQIHQLDLPVPRGSKIFPTLGWLVVVSDTNADMFMLHPFSRRTIKLPNPISLNEQLLENGDTWLPFFLKAVLSADPCLSSDWVLMIIYEIGKLAFVKNGDKVWTGIDPPLGNCSDIYYYERQFYGVDYEGNIVNCDVQGPNPTAGHVISRLPISLKALVGFKFYLAEWCGKFVVIHRSINVPSIPKSFRIFEIDFAQGNWVEVTHLGNKAIFLGFNPSITVDALEFRKCKPNCVYFTDDTHEGRVDPDGRDMGIYNMVDRNVEPHFVEESCSQIIPRWLQPRYEGYTFPELIPGWVQLNF
ncbi:Domain unknown function DUF295 [Dillenia turbinata]|uniref:KIB1-4 beta-propeller domain-containing protein n=1 Tax=Dillenia turbinata TaxID=194707 RepID=A0AAN8ZC93_9MAGN